MYLRLRDLREDEDLVQTKLAEFLNVHQTTYSEYERGETNIPIISLDKLADLYSTSVDY
ncbi:MAG: helix-turn-helix transcriptional regulator, partial [Clostridia bacterium]